MTKEEMITIDSKTVCLTNADINRLEDDFLMRLNVLAGVPENMQFDYYRTRHKTRVTSDVFAVMVAEARTLANKIALCVDGGGLNGNWPFDVLACYFAHKR